MTAVTVTANPQHQEEVDQRLPGELADLAEHSGRNPRMSIHMLTDPAVTAQSPPGPAAEPKLDRSAGCGPFRVPVLDSMLELGTLSVVVARGSVVVIPPPGGAFILPPRSDDVLCAAVMNARTEADRVRIGSATLDGPGSEPGSAQ